MNYKFLLIPLTIISVSINAQNTTIGDVDMGEIKNSDAFNQVKKLLGKWCVDSYIGRRIADEQCPDDDPKRQNEHPACL